MQSTLPGNVQRYILNITIDTTKTQDGMHHLGFPIDRVGGGVRTASLLLDPCSQSIVPSILD